MAGCRGADGVISIPRGDISKKVLLKMYVASLAVLTVLVASAMTQAPKPPMMSETFEAAGEVELHGPDITDFGEFVVARDQGKKMAVEMQDYAGRGSSGERYEELQDYNVKKIYYIRGDREHLHCIEEDKNVTGIMPKYWDWLATAKYEGTESIREITYDIWGAETGGVHLEFGKPQTNASFIYIYRRKTPETFTAFGFKTYSTTVDPKYFEVPSECRGK